VDQGASAKVYLSQAGYDAYFFQDANVLEERLRENPPHILVFSTVALQGTLSEFVPHVQAINDDIKFIVAKGVSTEVQRALDICRVAGNNAAHPGELNIEDTPEIAHMMFKMINFLVAELITRPNEINAMFDQLPQGARDAIEKRDAAK
jgi:hypothetical protein